VLTALASDGRAARRFLLDLVDDSDEDGLVVFLTNAAAAPERSGAVLLASSQPSTVATKDDDEQVARTMQSVLRTVTRMLDAQAVSFPRIAEDGRVDATASRWVLPTDLGLYAGRSLDRLVDPCDGARIGACPITSGAWPGWGEREVAHVLDRLASDERTASELEAAASAAFARRLQTLDLTDEASAAALENAAFVVSAVGAVRRNRTVERVVGDDERFDQMTAGLDLVITVAATALPEVEPLVTGAEAWGWASHIGAAEGGPTPGQVVLSPLRPRSVRDALAAARADDLLRAAVLQRAAAQATLEQLEASGSLDGPRPPGLVSTRDEPQAVRQALSEMRPGANADAPAIAYLDDVQGWVDAQRGSPTGRQVEHVLDSVGEAAARGAGWVA
jgi:hypothetical protein